MRRHIAALSLGLISSIAAAQANDGAAGRVADIDRLIAANYAGVEAMYKEKTGLPYAVKTMYGGKESFVAPRQPGGKPLPIDHSPYFAPVPEPSLKTGIKAMTLAVLGSMQR